MHPSALIPSRRYEGAFTETDPQSEVANNKVERDVECTCERALGHGMIVYGAPSAPRHARIRARRDEPRQSIPSSDVDRRDEGTNTSNVRLRVLCMHGPSHGVGPPSSLRMMDVQFNDLSWEYFEQGISRHAVLIRDAPLAWKSCPRKLRQCWALWTAFAAHPHQHRMRPSRQSTAPRAIFCEAASSRPAQAGHVDQKSRLDMCESPRPSKKPKGEATFGDAVPAGPMITQLHVHTE
ncbi:hypothetical protein RJ55_05566 [Drechmeria coniospora]|nr:hypothetical protein RJ55_05566 [Drechmeria coniospora]